MFDTVRLPCPHCSKFTEEQTKTGPCELETVYLHEADPSLVSGLGDERGFIWCWHCKQPFRVHMVQKPTYWTIKVDPTDDIN